MQAVRGQGEPAGIVSNDLRMFMLAVAAGTYLHLSYTCTEQHARVLLCTVQGGCDMKDAVW